MLIYKTTPTPLILRLRSVTKGASEKAKVPLFRSFHCSKAPLRGWGAK